MNTNEFDPLNPAQQAFTNQLDINQSLPDIDQLTKLANELFTALPCDGSRLGIAASAAPVDWSSGIASLDKASIPSINQQASGLPGEAALRRLFSQRQPSFANVPDHLDTGQIPGQPGSGTGRALPDYLADLDTHVLAGVFQHDAGLPGEAELQQLLNSQPPTGYQNPQAIASRSNATTSSSLPTQTLIPVPLAVAGKSSAEGGSSPFNEADLQKVLITPATENVPNSIINSSITGIPGSSTIAGLAGSLADLDASLIAELAPETYGLPGEAELQSLFAGFLVPQVTVAPDISESKGSSFYFLDELKTSGFNAQALRNGSAHPPFDVHALRRDFPILREKVNGYPLAWLDNAATTQKPQAVIDRVSYFYEHENSNIHRAAHELAARATDAYEQARDITARFLNAPSAEDIVFVRGTTEGINLVAQSWGRQNLLAGDEIVITWLEHHANIVPWQLLCEVTGAKLRVVPVDDSGQVLLGDYQKLLNSRTKLVSFTHVSNALGTVTPAAEIIAMAHRVGARVLLDAAQSVSHLSVDVQALDCDWCVFSGHKIFGPTGIGAVYGKSELLQSMPPWQGGGNMIEDVTFEKTLYQPAPARFEAGTGNIADAVGLGAALEYLTKIGIPNVARYEHELLVYAMDKLQSIPGLRLIGTAQEKTSVLSFVLAGHSNQDVGVALNKVGIAVRTGHHCAQPILRRFGLESTVRPSLAFYNTYEEIDRLVSTVKQIQRGNVIN